MKAVFVRTAPRHVQHVHRFKTVVSVKASRLWQLTTCVIRIATQHISTTLILHATISVLQEHTLLTQKYTAEHAQQTVKHATKLQPNVSLVREDIFIKTHVWFNVQTNILEVQIWFVNNAP